MLIGLCNDKVFLVSSYPVIESLVLGRVFVPYSTRDETLTEAKQRTIHFIRGHCQGLFLTDDPDPHLTCPGE